MQQGFGQVVDMDGFSLVGTMAFAFSGYLVGARKQLDLLGLVILSLLTAVGGGMVRDALIGDPPRVFFDNTAPLVALGTLTVAWLFGLHRKESRLINRLFIISDSIGLVAFSLAGAQIGIDMGMSLFGVVTLGFVTAIGGGIVRDVLCNQIPKVFHDHRPYTLCAVVGCVVLLGTHALGVAPQVAMVAGICTATGSRLLAVAFGWKLPTWPSRKARPRP